MRSFCGARAGFHRRQLVWLKLSSQVSASLIKAQYGFTLWNTSGTKLTLACLGLYINLIVYYYCLVDPGLSGLVQSCAADCLLNGTWAVGAIEGSRWFSPPSETVWLRRHTETQPWWRVSGCNYTDGEEQRWALWVGPFVWICLGGHTEVSRISRQSVQTQSLKWRNVKRGTKRSRSGLSFYLEQHN